MASTAVADLLTRSVVDLADLIKARQVSPVEVTTLLLDHARTFNPEVNAYISFREQYAMADAHRAEDELCGVRNRGFTADVWPGARERQLSFGKDARSHRADD